MNPLPPVPPFQQQADASHLNVLAICHFVTAGLTLLGLGFLVLHFMIMNSVFNNPSLWEGQHGKPPPPELWMIFRWFYLICGGMLVTAGVLNFLSGWWLRARRHRVFSMVVAGLNCCQVPLGTVLGVFTFIVLMRDSVRRTYDGTAG